MTSDLQRAHLAASLYYTEDRTQAEIGRFLGVSRPTVSRLLRHARQTGIVQIRIVDPAGLESDLGQALAAATGVRRAVVVAGDVVDPHRRRERLGAAAARLVEESVREGEVLGVGWGRTLRAVVDALQPSRSVQLTCVPLLGGLGQIAPSFQVHEITNAVAHAFGGAALQLYLPAIVSNDDTHRQLLESPDAALVLSQWDHLTAALVGIGNVDFDTEVRTLFAPYLDPSTQARLRRQKAAGDICMRFIDHDGHPVRDGLHGVIGIGLDQLQRVPYVIAVAGGPEKVTSILAALRAGLVHTLVTDEATARAALSRVGASALEASVDG